VKYHTTFENPNDDASGAADALPVSTQFGSAAQTLQAASALQDLTPRLM
jgi:hypothetical protein